MAGGKHLWPWRAIGSQCEVPTALMRSKLRLSQDPALNPQRRLLCQFYRRQRYAWGR